MIINSDENKFVELISKIPNVAVQGYDKNRRVIYWNKASEHIYGFSKEEALGQKLEDLIIPSSMKDTVIQNIENWYKDAHAIVPDILPLQHKNGSRIFVYSSHIMLGQDTGFPEMFCIDVDLTEQKKQENILKKQEKLLFEQSKMVSMGEMIGNIAHQWRQPLSLISTSSTAMIMEKEYNILTDEQLLKYCNNINDNAQYLSQTIDDFKNFIKGERIKKLFNLKDNINSFLHLVDGKLKNNNIKIILDLDDSIHINGYENELIQCLMNIVNNSKDALLEIVNDYRLIFISTSIKDDKIVISIKDNAQGIPENILPNIFEPYFTTKKQSQGTGLGLHMTHNLIVEGMNGTINAKNVSYQYDSNNQIGAEFTIALPYN